MWRLLAVVFIFSTYLTSVSPARILAVYPTPSISHQVVFRALTLELVKRGHEVVVITPDPVYTNMAAPANLTEIDISDSYKLIIAMMTDKNIADNLKRGVIMDAEAIMRALIANGVGNAYNQMNDLVHCIFDYTEVNQLIQDKSQQFDLVIIEGMSYAPLIFGKIFNAPVILFSSSYGTATNHEAVGSVARHPILHPFLMFRTKFRNLSFLDRIVQLIMEFIMWTYDQYSERLDNDFLKSRFGLETPSIAELKKNVMMLLVNVHPIFDGNRPVAPGSVYLGALHLQPTKELPQDLKTFLDNSTRGVVYVSLGTNVRPSHMHREFLDAFLDAFEKMPYEVLFKFDGDNLDRIPKNVKIQKWFPQRDLLGHPNLKVFITQGGLQSTDEAIDAEVPLVGIPMLVDQWYNTNKYVELGIGVDVDSYTMTADDLVKAVNKVANDPSYKKNIKKLKAFMQDQPETAMDRAVWWTEHVLRHKDSRYLLGGAALMSWSEYLMLDAVIPLVIIISIVAYVATKSFNKAVRLVTGVRIKVKQH